MKKSAFLAAALAALLSLGSFSLFSCGGSSEDSASSSDGSAGGSSSGSSSQGSSSSSSVEEDNGTYSISISAIVDGEEADTVEAATDVTLQISATDVNGYALSEGDLSSDYETGYRVYIYAESHGVGSVAYDGEEGSSLSATFRASESGNASITAELEYDNLLVAVDFVALKVIAPEDFSINLTATVNGNEVSEVPTSTVVTLSASATDAEGNLLQESDLSADASSGYRVYIYAEETGVGSVSGSDGQTLGATFTSSVAGEAVVIAQLKYNDEQVAVHYVPLSVSEEEPSTYSIKLTLTANSSEVSVVQPGGEVTLTASATDAYGQTLEASDLTDSSNGDYTGYQIWFFAMDVSTGTTLTSGIGATSGASLTNTFAYQTEGEYVLEAQLNYDNSLVAQASQVLVVTSESDVTAPAAYSISLSAVTADGEEASTVDAGEEVTLTASAAGANGETLEESDLTNSDSGYTGYQIWFYAVDSSTGGQNGEVIASTSGNSLTTTFSSDAEGDFALEAQLKYNDVSVALATLALRVEGQYDISLSASVGEGEVTSVQAGVAVSLSAAARNVVGESLAEGDLSSDASTGYRVYIFVEDSSVGEVTYSGSEGQSLTASFISYEEGEALIVAQLKYDDEEVAVSYLTLTVSESSEVGEPYAVSLSASLDGEAVDKVAIDTALSITATARNANGLYLSEDDFSADASTGYRLYIYANEDGVGSVTYSGSEGQSLSASFSSPSAGSAEIIAELKYDDVEVGVAYLIVDVINYTVTLEAEETSLSIPAEGEATANLIATVIDDSDNSEVTDAQINYHVYVDAVRSEEASGASASEGVFTATEPGTYYVFATYVNDEVTYRSGYVEITVTALTYSLSLSADSTTIDLSETSTLIPTITCLEDGEDVTSRYADSVNYAVYDDSELTTESSSASVSGTTFSATAANRYYVVASVTFFGTTYQSESVEIMAGTADEALLVGGDELVFVYGSYSTNDTYGDESVNAVYTGFETATYSSNSSVPWYSYRTSITTVSFDAAVAPTATRYWFYGMTSLASIENIGNLDTSGVTTMYCMFYNCSKLTSLDLSSFDTSSVTAMYCMFGSCTSLTSLDLSSFDTSSVTNMSYMFYGCSKLATIYVSSSWSTDAVTNSSSMNYMFYNCSNLPWGNTSYTVSTYNSSYYSNLTVNKALAKAGALLTLKS